MGAGLARSASVILRQSGGIVPPPPSGVMVGNSIFVSKEGNDATGTREDFVFSFLTIQAAIAVAISGDTIFVYPGTYTAVGGSDFLLPAGVKMHCYEGVTLFTNTNIQVQNIFGYADFNVGTVLNAIGDIECQSITFLDDGGQLYINTANTNVKVFGDIVYLGLNDYGIYYGNNSDSSLEFQDIFFANSNISGSPYGCITIHNPTAAKINIKFRDMYLTGDNTNQAGIFIDSGVGIFYESYININFNRIIFDDATAGTTVSGIYLGGNAIDAGTVTNEKYYIIINGNEINTIEASDLYGVNCVGSIGTINIGKNITNNGIPLFITDDGTNQSYIDYNGDLFKYATSAHDKNVYISNSTVNYNGFISYCEVGVRITNTSIVTLKGTIEANNNTGVAIESNTSVSVTARLIDLDIYAQAGHNIIAIDDLVSLSLKNVKMIIDTPGGGEFCIGSSANVDVQILAAYTNVDLDTKVTDLIGGLIVDPNITI